MSLGLLLPFIPPLLMYCRPQAPAIIFIDEIDAMGGKRGRVSVGTNSDRQTLNQLLACMDGFQKNEGIIVIGRTGVRFISHPSATSHERDVVTTR